MFAASSFDLLKTFFLNAYELPAVFVSVYGFEDDCGVDGNPGGNGCGSQKEPQPSSVRLKVSTEISLESTGFGAQICPQLLSLPSLDSCVKREKVSSSDKSWFFHDQGLVCVHRCPGPQLEHFETWAPCSHSSMQTFLKPSL